MGQKEGKEKLFQQINGNLVSINCERSIFLTTTLYLFGIELNLILVGCFGWQASDTPSGSTEDGGTDEEEDIEPIPRSVTAGSSGTSASTRRSGARQEQNQGDQEREQGEQEREQGEQDQQNAPPPKPKKKKNRRDRNNSR